MKSNKTSKGEIDKGKGRIRVNPEFISPCSLYCGVCAIHIADRDDNDKLKEKLVNLYQGKGLAKGTLPNSKHLSKSEIRCKGCLSNERFMHCQQCPIRDCTKDKGLEGCHQCIEFPCTYIDNFPMAVGKKVILRAVPERRELGTGKWVESEERRYHCPGCQNKVFRGAMTCNRCKLVLDLD